jgi:hypothetical protein
MHTRHIPIEEQKYGTTSMLVNINHFNGSSGTPASD